MYYNIILKYIFFIFLILILKPPLNDPLDLLFIILGLTIVFGFEYRTRSLINNKIFLFLLSVVILFSFFTKKKDISEYHSTFFSKKDINVFNNFLPDYLLEELKKGYVNFDLSRALASHDGSEFQSASNFNKHNFINKEYSFSIDNFYLRKNNTRNVDNISFSSRENLRISQINTLRYNIAFDKEFRREIPYFIMFNIPTNYFGSKICGQGNIYYSFVTNPNPKPNINIKDIDFIKKEKECIKFNENKNLYIFGYSINKKNDLSLKLHKNFINEIKDILNTFSIIIFILIFVLKFFSIKKFSRKEILAYIICLLSSFIFILLKDSNAIFGLRYFRGGSDGLVHEYRAYMIVYYLYNLNFFEFFRGGEDAFYFMPGLRYYLAITKLIFGDTNFGHILISFLLPISLFYLFKNIISEKIAFYLLILFTIIPIFENMGFGHFNYIHQIIRNHAESLAITIIIYCLSHLTKPNFSKNLNFHSVFLLCFILSFATFCRPNFFPVTSLIFLYLFIKSYNKNVITGTSALLGYSFILISFAHNVYFAGDYSFFTKTNVHFVFNDAFQKLNLNNDKDNLILQQFLKWNPIYNLHRLIMLIFVLFCFIKYKKNLFIYLIIFSIITQHSVLLLTHPDSRYAYLAWLLTFVMFMYYLFNNFLMRLK